MAATRTAKGTFSTKAYSDPTTAISSLTVAAKGLLKVGVGGTGTLASIACTWNGNAMTALTNYGASTAYTRTYYYYSSGGGTGDLVLSGTGPSELAVIATQWEGMTTTPFDVAAGSSGSGTTRSSGATTTTAQADEILTGFSTHEEDDAPSHGTNTGNASTDGQTATTSGGGGPTTEQSIMESYATVSSTGTYTHSRTGADNDAWAASISTWKIDNLTHYTIAADPGSYSVSGVAANLAYGRRVNCDVGSYAATGVAATLSRNVPIATDVGSYGVTGVDATFPRTYILAAEVGSYAVTGVNAAIGRSYTIDCDVGKYTVRSSSFWGEQWGTLVWGATGQMAFARSRALTTEVGAYSVGGVDATFPRTYQLPTDVGSYSVSGVNAATTKGYALAADPGSYTVSGVDAGALYGRVFPTDVGSYTVGGIDAGLARSRIFAADPGSYTTTGIDAGLLYGRAIPTDVGTYTVGGIDTGLLRSRIMPTDVGAYTVTGVDAALTVSSSYVFDVDPGSYTVTGVAADLTAAAVSSDVVVTLFESGRRTQSAVSPEFRTVGRGIRIMWDITAYVSGSFTFKVQVMTPTGVWIDLDGAATAAQSATGDGTLTIYPGAAETANVSVSDVITSPWRIYALAGGGSDMTFAIYALEIP